MTIVGSFGFVCGGLRFIWSYLVDRYSYKLSYTIILILQVIFATTLDSISKYPACFFIWVCVLISCEGGHFTLLPTICAKLFGENAAYVYGFAFSFCGLANFISVLLIHFILNDVGYATFFYMFGGFSFLSLLILTFFFKEEPVKIINYNHANPNIKAISAGKQ